MELSKIEQLNQVLKGSSPSHWDEVIRYAKYLVYRSNEGDLFSSTSEKDLLARSEASLEDVEAGRTRSVDSFKSEIEGWMSKKAM